jgi:membrane protein required for colicin V production
MSVDLFLLSLIAVFALLGALSGAAQQLANLAAAVVAWFSARPLGGLIAPWVSNALKISPGVGLVAATALAFIVVAMLVRWVTRRILLWILAGRDPESRTTDRTLGFIFGGLKVAFVAWVMLCALTFVEENVSVAGRHLGVSPADSKAFALARRYNLFELTLFAPVRDLVRVARASRDAERSWKLEQSPDYQVLKKDSRFRRAMDDRRLRAPLSEGDYTALVKNVEILDLIQDPRASERLRLAAEGIE